MGVFSEWSKETGCNPVAQCFVGSNPTAPIVSPRKLYGYVSLRKSGLIVHQSPLACRFESCPYPLPLGIFRKAENELKMLGLYSGVEKPGISPVS